MYNQKMVVNKLQINVKVTATGILTRHRSKLGVSKFGSCNRCVIGLSQRCVIDFLQFISDKLRSDSKSTVAAERL